MNLDRIETTILKNLLSDEEFARRTLPFIKPEYFTSNAERTIVEEYISFFDKYNKCATAETLIIDIDNKNTLTEQDYKDTVNLISEIKVDDGYKRPEQGWLIDTTEKFCQDRAIYNAVRESISILDDKSKYTKDAIPEILSNALGVSFDTHIGHNYLEDSDDRFDFYHNKETHYPFDIEYLNKITNGGLVSKTFNVFMGGPGAGKTLVMTHLAANYLMQGKNVLYITLEMAEERISERIDANLLNVDIHDLEFLSKQQYDEKVNKLRNKTQGKLIVKEYPTSQAGSAHFRHLMNELRLKKGFEADIVIVDYINICISSRFKFGSNVNSYQYIKSIAEELRGLAVERDVIMISATQVNREGFASSDMGMENTSESFGLPATADLFLGIIINEELRELNQIMFKQLKNRYNDANENAKFVVGIDRKKMRLYDCEQKAQVDVDDGPAFDKTGFGKKDFSRIKVI